MINTTHDETKNFFTSLNCLGSGTIRVRKTVQQVPHYQVSNLVNNNVWRKKLFSRYIQMKK